ncbi:DUF4239 domain-containing protein [Mycobacterium ahvazicum]|uniref:DUF4239 domain-containing protein n=1 Tax=Mycobacterium ahvazicum TaxID=1964395 RepID=A0A2K4Y9Q6_9MYCO|nr:DUF4239 domain-containing protein [Mycobacterium ahvazicum]
MMPTPVLGRDHNPAMSPFIAIVSLVYGALLGFTVVATWEQFSATQVIVANEASALTTMYRQTVAMPQPEQAQLQQLLRQYANAVAGTDRTKPGVDGGSDSARAAITDMYRIVGKQTSGAASNPIDFQFLSQLTALASDRNERIIGTKPRIPVLLWAGLIFGAVVLVSLTGFLRLGHTVGHAVVSSTIAVLLGLLLCIVFAFDHSFASDHQITAAPFHHALDVFDAVDRGT